MTMISKSAACGTGDPTTTMDPRQHRPIKVSAARDIIHRLLVALAAAPVFYGFAAQLEKLAQLLGACA